MLSDCDISLQNMLRTVNYVLFISINTETKYWFVGYQVWNKARKMDKNESTFTSICARRMQLLFDFNSSDYAEAFLPF